MHVLAHTLHICNQTGECRITTGCVDAHFQIWNVNTMEAAQWKKNLKVNKSQLPISFFLCHASCLLQNWRKYEKGMNEFFLISYQFSNQTQHYIFAQKWIDFFFREPGMKSTCCGSIKIAWCNQKPNMEND